jgi:hypothetical protein
VVGAGGAVVVTRSVAVAVVVAAPVVGVPPIVVAAIVRPSARFRPSTGIDGVPCVAVLAHSPPHVDVGVVRDVSRRGFVVLLQPLVRGRARGLLYGGLLEERLELVVDSADFRSLWVRTAP